MKPFLPGSRVRVNGHMYRYAPDGTELIIVGNTPYLRANTRYKSCNDQRFLYYVALVKDGAVVRTSDVQFHHDSLTQISDDLTAGHELLQEYFRTQVVDYEGGAE